MAELLASMPASELTEWIAYYQLAQDEQQAKASPPALSGQEIRTLFSGRVVRKAPPAAPTPNAGGSHE